MEMWILIGVVAVAAAAGIVRLASGRLNRRRVPLVLPETAESPSVGGKSDADDDSEHLSVSDPSTADVESTAASSVKTERPEMTDTLHQKGSPVSASRIRPSLFSRFESLVDSQKEDAATRLNPEELPLDDEQLVFGSATPALAEMLPESAARRAKQRQTLQAAGYYGRGAWLNLNAVRFLLAFGGLILAGLGLLAVPPSLEPYLLAAVVGLPLVGWALPPLVVSSKAASRRGDIERGLPDALDMLNMGVSQGLTVQSALKRIRSEIASAHPALAEELRLVTQQAQVSSLSQALNGFSRRIDSPEVTSFTSLLIQSEATGTSISRALTEYSDSMRSTIRERADARANAASFKLLFPTVLCLMPSVFLFLLGPAVVQLSDFAGNTASQLLENREAALNTLDQAPRFTPPTP